MFEQKNGFNLPELEEKVLRFWKENKIFEKTLDLRRTKKAKPFRFFEGPPTANGLPGIHHVLGRVFKDIILRYRTMRGFLVERRAGWDTHGLPVEIGVEKELGLKNKNEIEQFGIAEFNAKAKDSVWKYKTDWEKLTERIGFWLDMNHPYVTYDNSYIESLWWIFKKVFERGLLKQSYKVVPYCPRCQTPLSSHELGQPGVYKKTKDPSLFVAFKIAANEYLLVWTTTPWTLPANVAVAVNPQLTYTKFKINGKYFWSYSVPPIKDGDAAEPVEKISGKKLIGTKYEPLYKIKNSKIASKIYKVVGADFISTEDGTGLVHIAPAFGEDDFSLVKKEDLLNMVDIPVTADEQGKMKEGFPGVGKFVKQADKDILEDLEKRKLLYSLNNIEHEYPFCWRCSTPLLYFARLSWFIEMSRLRDELLAANKKINWVPESLKEGRFGEWLKEVKDWAVSRDRYWGTPLPFWECLKSSEHKLCVGSLDDLNKYAYNRNNFWLLRHGEGEHNLKQVLAAGKETSDNSYKLTSVGIAQATKAGKAFKKHKLDVIFASPYVRTMETAKIISEITGAPVVTDERLSEVDGGNFNGRPIGDYFRFFKDDAERFIKTPPGGENLTNIKRRTLAFLKDVNEKHSDKNILIVGHGDPLWMMEGVSLGLKNEEILNLEGLEVGGHKKLDFMNWPRNKDGELDLHRPFIDEVFLRCPKCGGKMSRVKEVADVWLDSGAMPFAGVHYPFENKSAVDRKVIYPADYIAEGIDQTRGWFYTLLAIATLLKKGNSYLNVVSLGLVLDKNGQKMSKSKGNVVDPWQVINKYGVDVIRWYFYTINPPAEPKRFDEVELGKTFRKFVLILYNSYTFFNLYAEKGFINKKQQSDNILDKWILGRLNLTIKQVTEKLDKYEIGESAREIEGFIDDLSRWYIRRSRDRFHPKTEQEKLDWQNASQTLFLVLENLICLISPFVPFLSEGIFQMLKGDISEERELSVHLKDWPDFNKKLIDEKLFEAMSEVRRLASLALAKRAEVGIKVRQPLAALKTKSEILKNQSDLISILKDEANVRDIIFETGLKDDIELDTVITPELKNDGLLREFVRLVQGLRHDANYQAKDEIALMLKVSDDFKKIIAEKESEFKAQVNAKIIDFQKSEKFDAELNSKIDDQPVWVGIRKI